MKFMSVRELRSSTAKLDEVLEKDGSIVVTNSGKPAYLMLGVDEESFEDTILDIARIRALRATRRIRDKAEETGRNTMTMNEIDEEIAASRKERKRRANV